MDGRGTDTLHLKCIEFFENFIEEKMMGLDVSTLWRHIHIYDNRGHHLMIEFRSDMQTLDFENCSKLLKAMAHPVRLRIIFGVARKECNVKSMWQCLNLPQDVVSQHLAILRKKNILKTTKKGNSVFYSINPELDLSCVLDFMANCKGLQNPKKKSGVQRDQ